VQETQAGLRIKFQVLFSDFKHFGMCRQVLMELSNIRFHENPLSGFRVTSSHVDKHDESNRHIFASFCWERGKNEQLVISHDC